MTAHSQDSQGIETHCDGFAAILDSLAQDRLTLAESIEDDLIKLCPGLDVGGGHAGGHRLEISSQWPFGLLSLSRYKIVYHGHSLSHNRKHRPEVMKFKNLLG
jgi:hypothetical protein